MNRTTLETDPITARLLASTERLSKSTEEITRRAQRRLETPSALARRAKELLDPSPRLARRAQALLEPTVRISQRAEQLLKTAPGLAERADDALRSVIEKIEVPGESVKSAKALEDPDESVSSGSDAIETTTPTTRIAEVAPGVQEKIDLTLERAPEIAARFEETLKSVRKTVGRDRTPAENTSANDTGVSDRADRAAELAQRVPDLARQADELLDALPDRIGQFMKSDRAAEDATRILHALRQRLRGDARR